MFPIWYDSAELAGWEPYDLHDLSQRKFPTELDLYHADPAQPLKTGGEGFLRDDPSVDRSNR